MLSLALADTKYPKTKERKKGGKKHLQEKYGKQMDSNYK